MYGCMNGFLLQEIFPTRKTSNRRIENTLTADTSTQNYSPITECLGHGFEGDWCGYILEPMAQALSD